MSIFDRLKYGASEMMKDAAKTMAQSIGNKKETFTFTSLPESLAEMRSLPEAALDNPFQTAALTVCALCVYGADRAIGIEMLNWLKGPKPLTPYEISFLNDRFCDNQEYIPFSFFEGAVPDNDYTPRHPFTIVVESTAVSDDMGEGYMKLFMRSGGADSPRAVTLRRRGDGKWFLWDQYLMSGIRPPKSNDPWA